MSFTRFSWGNVPPSSFCAEREEGKCNIEKRSTRFRGGSHSKSQWKHSRFEIRAHTFCHQLPVSCWREECKKVKKHSSRNRQIVMTEGCKPTITHRSISINHNQAPLCSASKREKPFRQPHAWQRSLANQMHDDSTSLFCENSTINLISQAARSA